MGGIAAARFETGVDIAASAVFAAAVGYALHGLIAPIAGAAGGVTIAFLLCFAGLRRVAPEEARYSVPDSIRETAEATPINLLLSEADRIASENPTVHHDELILDDILAEIGPQSRVVRLFDREAIPTPGQLQDRIEQHLGGGQSRDASQSLLDALAELRRSLN